jgi:Tfp pilus assembly protein PilF
MKKFAICVAMLVSAASVFSQAEKIKEAKKLAGGETPDFAKAISTINEALQNPATANDVEAWYTKGLIYSKQFDFEADKRFQVPPQTPDVNIQSEAAYNAYKTWLIADSLDVIESQNNPKRKGKLKYHNDIVKKVYANKDYLNNYGAILFQNGKAVEANKVFADVAALPETKLFKGYEKLNPNDSLFINARDNYKLTLRNVYNDVLSNGDTAKAERIAIDANKKYPEDPTFLTLTLQHDLWAGRSEQAKTKLDKAIQMNPNSFVYYLVRANINGLTAKTRPAADADYKKALSMNPESYDITYAYGDYKKMVGDDHYEEAINVERKDPAKAKAEREQFVANYNEAINYIEKARAMKSPADPGLLDNLAKVYAKLRSYYYSIKDNANFNKYDKLMKDTRAAM